SFKKRRLILETDTKIFKRRPARCCSVPKSKAIVHMKKKTVLVSTNSHQIIGGLCVDRTPEVLTLRPCYSVGRVRFPYILAVIDTTNVFGAMLTTEVKRSSVGRNFGTNLVKARIDLRAQVLPNALYPGICRKVYADVVSENIVINKESHFCVTHKADILTRPRHYSRCRHLLTIQEKRHPISGPDDLQMI